MDLKLNEDGPLETYERILGGHVTGLEGKLKGVLYLNLQLDFNGHIHCKLTPWLDMLKCSSECILNCI